MLTSPCPCGRVAAVKTGGAGKRRSVLKSLHVPLGHNTYPMLDQSCSFSIIRSARDVDRSMVWTDSAERQDSILSQPHNIPTRTPSMQVLRRMLNQIDAPLDASQGLAE